MARMSEQAGRYQRSSAGMVGAMLVLVLVVAASWSSATSTATTRRPGDAGGLRPRGRVRPRAGALRPGRARPSLPEGWRATTVEFAAGPTSAGTSACSPTTTGTSGSSRRTDRCELVEELRRRGRRREGDAVTWTATGRPGDVLPTPAATWRWSARRRHHHAGGRARCPRQTLWTLRRCADADAGRAAGQPLVARPIAASSRCRAPSSQLLADLGELLAALPQRQRLLEGGAARLEACGPPRPAPRGPPRSPAARQHRLLGRLGLLRSWVGIAVVRSTIDAEPAVERPAR